MSKPSIRLIRTKEDLLALEDIWDPLLERSLSNGVFLHWDWIITWTETLLSSNELFVIAAFDGDRLVGVAPLYLERQRVVGLVPLKRLRFMGAAELCADYLDVIVQKKNHAVWLRTIWDYLFSVIPSEWDVLDYSDSLLDSRACALFHKCSREDKRCLAREIVVSEIAPYMQVPDRAEDLLSSLHLKLRQNINLSKRLLTADGKEITVRWCQEPEDALAELARLKELNTRVWNERGFPGSLSSKVIESFHTKFALAMLKRDRLMLSSLWMDNAYYGGIYGFTHEKTAYQFIVAVEKTGIKRVNILNILVMTGLEEAIRRGCQEYDFLRGDEPWKYQWTDRDRRMISLRIYNRSVPALISRVISSSYQSLRVAAKFFLKRSG